MLALRYLVVDDSPTVRLTIRQALTQEKVPSDMVAEAATASEAIAAFDRDHPDVVFLDVSLTEGATAPSKAGPVLNLLPPSRPAPQGGNDVARYMIARDPNITVVVCTGNAADDPRVRELIKGGAFQLLQKPIRLSQIREVLRQVQAERSGSPSPG
ncbi:MAG TPA: response regulator [Thermoplasmata archaeon]|jgi:CheY-like chemotaxis protein|nr:response regulator [Thermoplasmata archaeon]